MGVIDCHLTEHQKQMLAALADGLESGDVKNKLRVVPLSDDGVAVYGLADDYEMLSEVYGPWETCKASDFDAFVECDLMEEVTLTFGGHRDFRLRKARIINFVKAGFKFTREAPTPTISVSGSQNVNIGIGTDIRQAIQNTPTMTSDEQKQLMELVDELNAALSMLPPENAQEKELIEEELKSVVDNVDKGRNKKIIQVKADALVNAAKTVNEVASNVLAVAMKISSLVISLEYLLPH